MLNERDDRSIGKLSEWCVGEEPKRWDIAFGARLAEQIRRWLGLATQARQSSTNGKAHRAPMMRKAA